jgi:hypothetical protein
LPSSSLDLSGRIADLIVERDAARDEKVRASLQATINELYAQLTQVLEREKREYREVLAGYAQC